MDNMEEIKQLVRDLLALLHKCCPPSLANRMFALETKAKQLGV